MQLQLVSDLKNVLQIYRTCKWTPQWFQLAHQTRQVLLLLRRPGFNPRRLRELMKHWCNLAGKAKLDFDMYYAIFCCSFDLQKAMGLISFS